jgi:peptidoglycan/xylan/chitin deacetylase (PgdA/CDA1 family)
LKAGRYNVLPLDTGLRLLRSGDLPPRSVVLTFDDGGYDFFALAHPLLKTYGFPATVYQTTYYAESRAPVFNLICSYLLWKRRGSVLKVGGPLGMQTDLDLRTEKSRESILLALLAKCSAENLTGEQKDRVARRVADALEIDYDAVSNSRRFHLMNSSEIAVLAAQGIDFQLHTHRHRTPTDEAQFRKEILDNRRVLETITGTAATHFCYPGGRYDSRFMPWLLSENIVSATTCDAGFATSGSDPLLLPRFVDSSGKAPIDFESWLTGVGSLLAVRTAATRYRRSVN